MKYIFLTAGLMISTTHRSLTMEMKISTKKILKPSKEELCIEAIQNNNPKKLKTALSAGADVNYINKDGKSLFYLADKPYSFNFKEMLQILITHENIDINSRNSKDSTPLHLACGFGFTTTIKTILKKAPQSSDFIDKEGNTPLHTSAGYAKKSCTELLLFHDIKAIDSQNYHGYTPLHIACGNRRFEIITFLIKNGANPTIKSNSQATPLVRLFFGLEIKGPFYPFLTKNPDIAHKLIYEKDKQDNSQLHLSTTLSFNSNSYDKFEAYLCFLAKKLNIYSRNKDGKKAVDLACDAYNKFYNLYITMPIETLALTMIHQEQIMHAFLRLTSPHTPCAEIKHVLTDRLQLPEELLPHIMYNYYALNSETIIAKKYKYNNDYYKKCIQLKHKVKQQLLENPEPQLLWKTV